MTLWQDQTSRRDRSGVAPSATSDYQEGRPLSRREARERERRAAEALAEGRAHPSGVYDFDRHDLGPNPAPLGGVSTPSPVTISPQTPPPTRTSVCRTRPTSGRRSPGSREHRPST